MSKTIKPENFIKLKELKDKYKKLNSQVKSCQKDIQVMEEICIKELKNHKLEKYPIKGVGVFAVDEKREFFNPSTLEEKKIVYGCLKEILWDGDITGTPEEVEERKYEKVLEKLTIHHTSFNSLINEYQDELETYYKDNNLKVPEGRAKGVKMLEKAEEEKDKNKKYELTIEGQRLIKINPFVFEGVKPGRVNQKVKVTKR